MLWKGCCAGRILEGRVNWGQIDLEKYRISGVDLIDRIVKVNVINSEVKL